MIAILSTLFVAAASAQTPYFAHPANPMFQTSPAVQMYEFAPGSRVLILFGPILNSPGTGGFSGIFTCFDSQRLSLAFHSLGTGREYRTPLSHVTSACGDFQAVIPADIPLGPAEAVIEDESGNRYGPVSLRIIPFDFKVLNETGFLSSVLNPDYVPRAMAYRVDGASRLLVGLTTAATPGTIVALRGAGLGNSQVSQITIQLGETLVTPRAARSVADEPGLEDLEFVVPSTLTVSGCYVPVRVRFDGRDSNITSIPLMPAPGPCKHRLGLSPKQLQLLDNGSTVPIGTFSFSQASFRSEDRVTVAQLTGLDSASSLPRCRIIANPFFEVSSITTSGPALPFPPRSPDYFDAGDQVRLVGPDQVLNLVRSPSPNYNVQSNDRRPASPGPWQLQSDGGLDVPPLQWNFHVPPSWEPANVNTLAKMRSGDNPELQWDGSVYEPGERVTLSLSSSKLKYSLSCSAPGQLGAMPIDVTAILDAFDPPATFAASITLSVDRDPFTPLVFPLKLADGTEGAGVWTGSFQLVNRTLQVEVH